MTGTIKEIKHFNSSNEYDSTPIGCNAENVDMADGSTLEETITDLKKSVSDGKTAVANAITDKGVKTATDAEFATMAENISKIESGSGGGINIFTQETEPDKKEGIWIQTPNPYNDIVVGNSTYSNPTAGEFVSFTTPLSTTYNGFYFGYKNKMYYFYNWTLYILNCNEWIVVKEYDKTEASAFHTNTDDRKFLCVHNNYVYFWNPYFHTINMDTYELTYEQWYISPKYCSNFVIYNNKLCFIITSSTTAIYYTYDIITREAVTQNFPTIWCNNINLVVFNGELHAIGGNSSTTTSNQNYKHYKFDGTEWILIGTVPFTSSSYNGCRIINYNNSLLNFTSGNTTYYKFDGVQWETLKFPATIPTFYSIYVLNNSIYFLYTQTNSYFITFDEIDNVTGQTVAIYQNADNDTGTYSTNLLDGIPITGKNNKFPSGFDNVYYLDSDGYVEESPTYYGDGTQWVKFKN